MRALVLSINELFGFLAAAALGSAGVRTSVIGSTPWSRSRISRYCHRYLHAGDRDLREGGDAFLEQVGRQCRILGIDVLFPADLPTARMMVARRAALPVRPFPLPESVDVLDRLHDKERFAKLLDDCGVPHPGLIVFGSSGGTAGPLPSFPAIAKPADGEAGRGVRRLDSPEDLARYLREHATARTIVQPFIEGEDVDLSLLADHGRVVAWTIQRRDSDHPELMHFLRDDRLLDFGRRIVERVGYHGLAHLDMRIERSTGRPFVIECNPRLWGSFLYSVWAGVNFAELGVRLAMDGKAGPEFRPVEGDCLHSGIAPRRLLRSLLGGRFVPPGLSASSRQAWIFNHSDPLPLLAERFLMDR